jgi:hypothetical protein
MSQDLYQFFRNETAAVERGARGKKKIASQLFSEFTREPGFEAHVAKSRLPLKPLAPITHYNAIPAEALDAFAAEARAAGKVEEGDLRPSHPVHAIPALLRAWKARHAQGNGRHLQKNAQVLLCPVISYPKTIKQIKKEGVEAFTVYRAWIKDCVQFAKDEWGDQFIFCGEHADEKYGHLHLYGLPKFEAGKLTLGFAHPGQYMARSVKTGARAAYIQAMREQQDRFYEQVSVKYGHKRRRPVPGSRTSRQEWKVAEELRVALEENEKLKAYIASLEAPKSRPSLRI